MSNKGSAVVAVFVSLLVFLVMLGGAELVLRLFAPVHLVGIQSAYQYDEELGYRLSPSVHRYQLTDHLEEIRTNAIGSVNFQESFEKYRMRVFAAGDSFTQGTGNSSDSSYPFQLDLLLNQDKSGLYRGRYGVVNLGLAAFGTEQSLIALRRYSKLLGEPDYVLYLGSDNDWEDDQMLRSGYRHRHIVAGSPRWGRLVGPMLWLNKLELVKRAKLATANFRRPKDIGQEATGSNSEISVAELVWPSIERIVALTREWDAVLVLSWANPDSDSYSWLQKKAAEEAIRFADWAPAVESVRETMPDLPIENPHSGGHWRPWVNSLIALNFAREIGATPPLQAAEAIPTVQ